jgi:hypothetical protein
MTELCKGITSSKIYCTFWYKLILFGKPLPLSRYATQSILGDAMAVGFLFLPQFNDSQLRQIRFTVAGYSGIKGTNS